MVISKGYLDRTTAFSMSVDAPGTTRIIMAETDPDQRCLLPPKTFDLPLLIVVFIPYMQRVQGARFIAKYMSIQTIDQLL